MPPKKGKVPKQFAKPKLQKTVKKATKPTKKKKTKKQKKSEPELTDKVYFRKKYSLYRKVVLTERQLKMAWPLCKSEKLDMYVNKRKELLEGTSPEYMTKMTIKKANYEQKSAINENRRSLEMDAMKREFAANESATLIKYDNRFEEFMIEDLKERHYRMRAKKNAEILPYARHLKSQIIPDKPLPKQNDKLKKKVKKMFAKQNIPLIVHQLDDSTIEEDLRFYDECILQADLRSDELQMQKIDEVTVTRNNVESLIESGFLGSSKIKVEKKEIKKEEDY